MPKNTRSSELRKEIEFRLEMADSKPTPEAINSIEALIASKVREARIDELSMLERAVERMSWGQYIEARKSSLATLQPREQDKV